MGNTVGSYETTHWHKRWIPVKKSIHLTSRQKELILGSLLGDGAMRVGKGSINANFKVEHGLQQKAYVEWKYSILRPFVFTGPKISYRYGLSKEPYPKSWWFRTVRHPELSTIYRMFYRGEGYRCGRKITPASLQKDLTPLVLAVWIMDDGSYAKGSIELSTYAFTKREIFFLQYCLRKGFSVEASLVSDRDRGYRLYCTRAGTKRLIEIIRVHIIPSMQYKIGLATP